MILQNLTLKNPRNPLIYVIDSNASYRKIILSCLKALNYCNIHLYGSTGECLLAEGSPDIIILDNNQGRDHLSGIEFFRVYRKKFQTAHFLFLSSSTNLDVAVNAMKLGAYDYIVKSKLGLERLIERVDKLVNIYRKDLRRKILHRITLVTLGIFSIVFLLAIYLYTHQ
jgi:DNA-binding response OmpR family regulator